MAVRVLIWNLYHFGHSTMAEMQNGQRVVNTIHPPAGRLFDIVVLIEPYCGPAVLGQVVLNGAGVEGLQTLFYALQVRDGNWRLVPPRCLANGDKRELVGIYYHSTTVAFHGPDALAPAHLAPVPLGALPAFLAAAAPAGVPIPVAAAPYLGGAAGAAGAAIGGMGLGALPAVPAWAAGVIKGMCRFPNNAGGWTAFAAGPDRRPYLAEFSDLTAGAPAPHFRITGLHAPPKPSLAPGGIAALGNAIALHAPPQPTLIAGDFNCCTIIGCISPSGHTPAMRDAIKTLCGPGAHSSRHNADALRAIRAAIEATTHFAAGGNPIGNAAQARAQLTTARNMLQRIAAVIPPALVPMIGAGLPAGFLTAANALAHGRAARDAALGIARNLAAMAELSPFVRGLANAANSAAEAIDTGTVGSTRSTGDFAQAACDGLAFVRALAPAAAGATINQVGVPGPLLTTATTAAAAAAGVTNATAAVTRIALAIAARDSLLALEPHIYQSHIGPNPTSLRLFSNAAHGAYRLHAYDHILTRNFRDTQDAVVLDVIAADASNPGPAVAPGTFRAFFKRWRKPITGAKKNDGVQGVSDHLPVRITITI